MDDSPGSEAVDPESVPTEPRWSVARIVVFSALIAIVFQATQAVVVAGMIAREAATRPDFDVDAWAQSAGTDGVLLALGTIAAAATTVPFMRFLAGRREPRPWRFLGFERTSAVALGRWLLALAAFIVASDALTTALGRPVVPEFMTSVFATADPLLLLAALVVAAPLGEELFFRGFVFGALESRGVPTLVVAVITSAVWALIHMQYDWYGIATIFAMGLLLAAARARTGSVLPCLAMHGSANAVATAQAALWI